MQQSLPPHDRRSQTPIHPTFIQPAPAGHIRFRPFSSARLLASLCLVLALCAGLAACAAKEPRRAGQSGFLGDYSQLVPGEPGKASMIYRKPGLDTRKYRDIVIDPVRVVLKPDADREVDPASLNSLATLYRERLVDEISPVYPLARVVGPQTLRLRVAITDVVPGKPVRNVMSIMPVGFIVSQATYASTGEYPDVGQSETELELLDAVTGERLVAAVDRRVGTKAPLRAPLDDAKDAIEAWAGRIAAELAKVRVQ